MKKSFRQWETRALARKPTQSIRITFQKDLENMLHLKKKKDDKEKMIQVQVHQIMN